MKYSILLPFWRRLVQFQNTLVSFRHHYAKRADYEVMVVVDQKHLAEEIEAVYDLVERFKDIPIKVISPQNAMQTWQSPVVHYNQAARESTGEYLIISNPENFHAVNILAGLDEEFAKDHGCYVICSCLSIFDQGEEIDTVEELITDRVDRWYQHSVHTPRDLHFCSAISRERFKQAGGFDEEFRHGIAYDDDDFREAVRKTKAPFVRRDDLLTYHLYHERSHLGLRDYRMRIAKNKARYLLKWRK